MDFYGRRAPYSPVLGLEEGESRKTCPPGYVKSYLPQFPWSECIPEDQALKFQKLPTSVQAPGPTATRTGPPPLPAAPPAPPPPPPLPSAPKKARFLTVHPKTGDILDPDTGAVVQTAMVYSVDTTDFVAIGAGVGVVVLLLGLAGVFSSK